MKLWNTTTTITSGGYTGEQYATVKADTKKDAIAKVEKVLKDKGYQTTDSDAVQDR